MSSGPRDPRLGRVRRAPPSRDEGEAGEPAAKRPAPSTSVPRSVALGGKSAAPRDPRLGRQQGTQQTQQTKKKKKVSFGWLPPSLQDDKDKDNGPPEGSKIVRESSMRHRNQQAHAHTPPGRHNPRQQQSPPRSQGRGRGRGRGDWRGGGRGRGRGRDPRDRSSGAPGTSYRHPQHHYQGHRAHHQHQHGDHPEDYRYHENQRVAPDPSYHHHNDYYDHHRHHHPYDRPPYGPAPPPHRQGYEGHYHEYQQPQVPAPHFQPYSPNPGPPPAATFSQGDHHHGRHHHHQNHNHYHSRRRDRDPDDQRPRQSRVRRHYKPGHYERKGHFDILKGRYGNYHNYYARRHDGDNVFACDLRVASIRREWIQNKDCVDFGCNEGPICIELASEYKSKTMKGIDVDEVLVDLARRNLSAKRAKIERARSDGSRRERQAQYQEQLNALDNTEFVCADFMFYDFEPESVDTVLCLSVTKWVHLCHGDNGIHDLFQIFSNILRSGGHLCLEYQPFSSYKTSTKKEELKRYFKEDCPKDEKLWDPNTLQTKPNQFEDLLLHKYGFTFVEDSEHCARAKIFSGRPMKIFQRDARLQVVP